MDEIGSSKTHRKQRQKLRRRLEAEGWPRAVVDRRVDDLRRVQDDERAGRVVRAAREAGRELRPPPVVDVHWRERLEEETYRRFALDDAGFRPRRPDPLLTGAARLTGTAAKAARQGKAMTRWQWGQQEAKAVDG